MADRNVPNLPGDRITGLIEEHNNTVDALKAMGAVMHNREADPTLVVNPDASDLPSTLLVANEAKSVYNAHIASTDSHVAADGTNDVTSADATDQGSANTLLNEIKADFNAHQADVAFHNTITEGGFAPPVAIATADASDAGTSVTLANVLKEAFNAHAQSAARKISETFVTN